MKIFLAVRSQHENAPTMLYLLDLRNILRSLKLKLVIYVQQIKWKCLSLTLKLATQRFIKLEIFICSINYHYSSIEREFFFACNEIGTCLLAQWKLYRNSLYCDTPFVSNSSFSLSLPVSSSSFFCVCVLLQMLVDKKIYCKVIGTLPSCKAWLRLNPFFHIIRHTKDFTLLDCKKCKLILFHIFNMTDIIYYMCDVYTSGHDTFYDFWMRACMHIYNVKMIMNSTICD